MRLAEADSRLSSQQAAVMSDRLREVQAAVQAAQAQLAYSASARTAEGEPTRTGWSVRGVDAMTPLLLQVKEETLITQQQVWELEHLTKEEERRTRDVQDRRQQVQTLATAALAPSAPRHGRPVEMLIQAYEALVSTLQGQIDEVVVKQGGAAIALEQAERVEQCCADLARENERLSLEHKQQLACLGKHRHELEYAQSVSDVMMAELKKQHAKCDLMERLVREHGCMRGAYKDLGFRV